MPTLRPQREGIAVRGILLLAALFFIAWGIGVLSTVGFLLWRDGPEGFLRAATAFGIACAGFGIWMLTKYFLRPTIARAKISPPEVSVSTEEPKVGEEFSVTCQQRFKGAADVKGITLSLVFRETAVHGSGRSTKVLTDDEIIHEFKHPGRRYDVGEVFQDRRTLRIPEGAMHTFIARYNKLQWFVKVRVEMAGWPDLEENYEIRVLPEIVR